MAHRYRYHPDSWAVDRRSRPDRGVADCSRPVAGRSPVARAVDRRSRPVVVAARHNRLAAGAADHSRPAAGVERHTHLVEEGVRHSRPVPAAEPHSHQGAEAVAAGSHTRPAEVAGVARRSRPDCRVAAHSHRAARPMIHRGAHRAGCARLRSFQCLPHLRALAPPLHIARHSLAPIQPSAISTGMLLMAYRDPRKMRRLYRTSERTTTVYAPPLRTSNAGKFGVRGLRMGGRSFLEPRTPNPEPRTPNFMVCFPS
jgi:hypothetical protein